MRKYIIKMMEHTPFGLLLVDGQGKIMAKNNKAEILLRMDESVSSLTQLSSFIQENVMKCIESVSHQFRLNSLRFFVEHFQEESNRYILLSILEDDGHMELEAIVNGSFDEIFVTDGEGVITRLSERCKDLYGVPAEQLIGKKAMDLAEEGIFTPSLTPKIIREKKTVSSIQMTKTGKKLYVTGKPIFDTSGEIYRIIFNSREFSEIEALENRLQETEHLLNQYRTELNHLKQLVSDQKQVIYESSEMKQIYQLASKVAQVDSTVLIVGETGAGKGVMARYMHQESQRSKYPFIQINCGAIPENLIESELFGYENGAFTGAKKNGKKGVFELAENGTLFLDEIGELPLNVQVKLLQFLQDRTFRRVGGNELVQVNTRVIAATNKDLLQSIKEKRFREDLYYRLNVVPLTIPPLRQRKEDIPALIKSFAEQFNAKYEMTKQFSEDVIAHLTNYDWPGNVRELENLIERLIITCDENLIIKSHLPDYLLGIESPFSGGIIVKGMVPLKEATEEVERQLVTMVYQTYGNTYRCAEVLQVNQSTAVRKINKYIQHKKRRD
ncbi:sigma-54 interaction domain-containing protein [Priestia abyssalis]|uniref:sigma-54 interaction domain-containing protein n=1 Tax=Priestia abyssalis TaxID=1221450 RepID=UPI0019596A7D|nr:sigma 54-interacting transcriptional regulator [Priestia abyssalis]